MIYIYNRFKPGLNAGQRFRLELPFKDKDYSEIYIQGHRFLRWLKEEIYIWKYVNKSSTYIYNRWPTSLGFSIALSFKKPRVIMDIDDLVNQNEHGKNFVLNLLFISV